MNFGTLCWKGKECRVNSVLCGDGSEILITDAEPRVDASRDETDPSTVSSQIGLNLRAEMSYLTK